MLVRDCQLLTAPGSKVTVSRAVCPINPGSQMRHDLRRVTGSVADDERRES